MTQTLHDPQQDAAGDEEMAREFFLRSLDTFPVSDDLDNPVDLDVALDHYLEKLREREETIAQNAAIAQRRIEMIMDWQRDANASAERECQWLRQQIEAFARSYDFGKKKSRSLPNGTFGFRSKPDTLEIIDPAAAVAFAKAHALEVKESVNKTPLLTHFKATGEIPDGCEFVEGGESLFIKAGS